MEDYLAPAVWPISIGAVASRTDPVVFQGLEILSCVCEAELDLIEEDCQSTGWIQPALEQLLPVLIQGTCAFYIIKSEFRCC